MLPSLPRKEDQDAPVVWDDGLPFALENQAPPARRSGQSARLYGVGGLLVLLLLSLGTGVWWAFDLGLFSSKQAHAYLELRALDELGRPLAGAEVLVNAQVRGRTDSFGEFREYLATERGARLQAEVRRDQEFEQLRAVKNFIVPLRIRIGDQVRLVADLKLLPKPQLAQDPLEVSEQNEEVAEQEVNVLDNEDAKIEKTPRLKIFLKQGNTLPTVTIEARKRTDYLNLQVAEALKESFLEFTRDQSAAPWQSIRAAEVEIILAHLEQEGKPGLMYVKAKVAERSDVAFLLGYKNDLAADVRSILGTLNYYLDPELAVNPPRPHWQSRSIKLFSSTNPDTLEVFVAGYQASRFGSDKWRFWSPQKGRANLTVVSNYQIVHRERIEMVRDHLVRRLRADRYASNSVEQVIPSLAFTVSRGAKF